MDSPFLLPPAGAAAAEAETATRWSASSDGEAAPASVHGESPLDAGPPAGEAPRGPSGPDPYLAIRPAFAPAHAQLSAGEVEARLGRRPGIIALHQMLGSPVPQQAALAVLLGGAGRRSLPLGGSEVPVPAYLRMLGQLCREAADHAEATAPPLSLLTGGGGTGAAPAPPQITRLVAGAAGRQDGIDVYEGNTPLPPFNDMERIGIRFIFHKSSERLSNGVLYSDRQFVTRWADTGAAGIIRGSFHYYRHLDHASGDVQADEVVGQVERLLPGDLAPSLDFEGDAVATHSGEPTAREWRAELEAFLDRIEVRLGRTPFVYTSERAWREHISGKRDFRPAEFTHFREYPLWTKEYLGSPTADGINTDNKPNPLTNAFKNAAHKVATGRYNARDRGTPRLPASWTGWEIWQYSQYTPAVLDRSPFHDLEIDFDVTSGGLYTLRGLADLGRTAPHSVGNLVCIAYTEADGAVPLLEYLDGSWRSIGDVVAAAKSPSPAAGDPAAIGLGRDQVVVYRARDNFVYALSRSPAGADEVWSAVRISDDAARDDPSIAAVGNDLHVVYRDDLDRQAHLVRAGGVWRADDLAVVTGAPTASGSAAAYVVGAAFHLVSRAGTDGHLFDLYRSAATPRRDDLTALAHDENGGPPPAATYRPAVLAAPGRAPRIVFRALRGAIWTIERDTLRARNLTAAAVDAAGHGSAAPNAAGSPTAVFSGAARVFYRAVDSYQAVGGIIIEIFEDGGTAKWREVCAGAAADPVAYVGDNGCIVAFRAEDGSIRAARLVNDAWICEAATVTVSPSLPAAAPTGVGAAEAEVPFAAVAPAMEAQLGDPPPSPFPARFVDPHASSLDRRNRVIAAFHAAIHAAAIDPAFDAIPGIDTVPLAIVALDGDGSRPLAGQRHFEMYYSASLLKVAAMYAAFQLRVAVNDLAAPLDPASVPAGDLFARLENAFDPQIKDAVPRINRHRPAIGLAMRVPKYREIFDAVPGHGHWRLNFSAAFDANLHAMIVASDDAAAGVCIRALGYSWINGVLQSAGFFDDTLTGREGIWLAGDYNRWPTVEIDSLNDGPVKQATTCFHMASLFVQLFDNKLVDDAPPHSGGNDAMRQLLAQAVDDPGAPSLLKRVFGPDPPPFEVIETKIGVGELKGGDCRGPDAAGHARRNRCVYSEASILRHPPTGRKFVAVWQNLTFLEAHPTWWDLGLTRIVGVIRHTMDNYHP